MRGSSCLEPRPGDPFYLSEPRKGNYGTYVMVFSKGRILRSSAEIRTAAEIVFQDIKRLTRSNSAVLGASRAKASRICTQFMDVLRLLRYDATNLSKALIDRDKSLGHPSKRIERLRRVFPICFTCAKHFELLRLALFTLGTWAPWIEEVNIYIDNADPFSPTQCELLRAESQYRLSFHGTTYPMSREGTRSVLNELYAFRKLVTQMVAEDVLLKFDSDVIFLSDVVFHLVTNGDGEAIGTSVLEYCPALDEQVKEYMQGGCYFIAATKLRSILSSLITRTALAILRERGRLFEDQFISRLLDQCGTRIVYKKFMSEFDEPHLEEGALEARLRAIPADTAVLHFEGNNKSNMRRVADRLFPSVPPT
jgi:hypothetical protein